LSLKPFKYSYPDYHEAIESAIFPGIRICEIGPSGNPSIKSSEIRRRNLDYTIIDVETIHWKDYNLEVNKHEVDLQRAMPDELKNKFDLVISQMVLEHIEQPDPLHNHIAQLLRYGGTAIHLYANPYSLSALVNRLLPDFIGEFILDLVSNRDLSYDKKYPAFYNNCHTPSERADLYFSKMSYSIKRHDAYAGHNYFQHVPVLRQLEVAYSRFLLKLRLFRLSTLSLLVLIRNNER